MSTTHDTEDRQDEQLRALLASIDPAAGAVSGDQAATPSDLLERVLAEAPEGSDDMATALPATPASAARGGFWSRHWQGTLLVAASVATLALAGATVAGPLGFVTSASDSAAESQTAGGAVAEQGAPGAARADASDSAALADGSRDAVLQDRQEGVTATAPQAADQDTAKTDETLIRSGSVLVGTDDQKAGRDTFVTTVTGMGGRILSEAVVTEGGQSAIQPMGGESRDMVGVTYPYPWWPSGPGIWLTVQVPAEHYDEAMAAARATGEVVSLQQSSYDVGTQIADTDARIAALEDSLKQLRALMDETSSVSEVIKLEAAISNRQAELDGLRAQQRELANQTQMSQISLTLMSPDDATASVDPQPTQTWWESFVAGLADAWAWLGKALMIVSPLLVALGIIVLVRRRRRRRPGGDAGGPGAVPTSGTEPAAG